MAPEHRRRFAAAALLAALAAGGPVVADDDPDAGERAVAARMMQELMSGRRDIGGDFSLPDHSGRLRALAEFRGRFVLLYFGYTWCPDLCPGDLAAIAAALRELGPRADQVQPLFVTLDPERDRGETLGAYAAAFDPRFVALRGGVGETRRLAESFRVYYRQVRPAGAADYMIDHTPYVFLLDRDGRYVAFFPPATPAGRIAEFLRQQF